MGEDDDEEEEAERESEKLHARSEFPVDYLSSNQTCQIIYIRLLSTTAKWRPIVGLIQLSKRCQAGYLQLTLK